MRRLAALFVFVFCFALPAAAAIDIPAGMDGKTLEQWQEKEQLYIKALDRVRSVNSTMNSYLRWAKDGPADAKKAGNFGDMSSSLERVQKAAEDNAKIAAKIQPMDTALDEMAKAATELKTIGAEANKYYSRKDYLADELKRGKEMHPELIQAYNAFTSAADNLNALQDELTDKLEPQKLENIAKKYGKEYYWQHVKLMGKARAVISLLDADKPTDAGVYGAALTAFTNDLKEFETYMENAGEESIRKQARMPLKGDSFNSFLAAAREFGQDLESGKTKTSAYANHFNNLVRQYNNLVNSANRTTFISSK